MNPALRRDPEGRDPQHARVAQCGPAPDALEETPGRRSVSLPPRRGEPGGVQSLRARLSGAQPWRAQNFSNSRLKARSQNQMAASSAISAEPPTKMPWLYSRVRRSA